MQWTGGKLARPVHSDSSLCPSIFRDKDPSFFLVKGRHHPHEGFMTCFMERSERSCCHFLNSFSLKYVLCLGAVFGSSMSWTPWAGNCTSWKAQRVALFFSFFFSFLYYQEQTGTLFICEIRLLFLSLHEERQLGWWNMSCLFGPCGPRSVFTGIQGKMQRREGPLVATCYMKGCPWGPLTVP